MKLKIKFFRQTRGLAFKLILFIFTSVAIIFSITFLYTYNISRKIVEKNLRQNAASITTGAVIKVDKVLGSVQNIANNYSKIIEDSDHSRDGLLNILKQLVENNPEIFGVGLMFEPYYIDPSLKYNTLYVYRRDNKIEFTTFGEDVDYFTMDYYQIPKELNRSLWIQPYFDEGVGNVVMTTYSVPLYKYMDGKEQLVGVLGVDLSLDWLQEYFNSIKIYKTGYAFMISSIGTIVSHPNKSVIMNETIFSIADAQKSQQLREIGHNMIHGETSFAEIEYHNLQTGKLSWIAYAPVPTNNWSVGLVFPVEEFMADVNNLFINLLIIGIGGLVIILIIIIFISRSITSPLRMLTHAAGRFAQGDFDVELPIIKTNDEIGKLNASFIYMQNKLASTINDLLEASSKLKISNEKLEEYSRTLEQKVDERTAELKDKNKELDSAFNNVRTLNEIGKKITSTLNIELIQEMVYEHVNSLLDATSFLIMIYNEREHKLECKLSMEKGEKLPPFEVSMEEKNRFAVWCVDNASPIFMNDVENEYMQYVPDRAKPKAGESVSSLIYLPLMIENRILGVISAQSFRKNVYNQYQFDMLSNLANFIAIALENALAYEKINKANSDLKAAQVQLVQSEKMASLGQLTAGIAHEIKNPLNFVNNFSELSLELAGELTEEIDKLSGVIDPKDTDNVRSLLRDIENNVKKINEHGKRADSIVRGMLLHSRGRSGEKQPTDLNALLAEYVGLGYHGMRATDNTFNIKIETEYDSSIGLVNVVPQDMSRVFLNLINNAYYSTAQKKKELKDSYFPILNVSTLNAPDKITIRIRDNGKGIPRSILDRIFNPFFTTKPAGSGTGLGLSISYDIIVQEHHGEIRVESVEGEFAEFVIIIPNNLI